LEEYATDVKVLYFEQYTPTKRSEGGDRIQLPKDCDLNKKKNKAMDNVQKLTNCINIP
jgi:hypothetical protein